MYNGRLYGPGAVALDHLDLRRHNLALVLRGLREAGPRSRARIAADIGLTKATVSSLVAELVELGLVRDGELERDGGVGRPGQVVELEGRVCGLGIEIRADGVAAVALDLRGSEVLASRVAHDVAGAEPARTLDVAASVLDEAVAALRRRGLEAAGATVAVPGAVERETGTLRRGPGAAWRDVPVVDELVARLTQSLRSIRLENDANLCALAELLTGSGTGVTDMVYLNGQVGVGAGVISGGALLSGADGYGGEVGHLPIGDPDHGCGCGRRGCWEADVGLGALLREVADPGDLLADPAAGLEKRLSEIRRRAELGDGRTLRGLRAVGTGLGLGATILTDLLNPRLIVLGGYFAVLGDFLVPAVEAELKERTLGAGLSGCRIEVSTLGFAAACRGGAHMVLETVLADPASTVHEPDPIDAPARGHPREEYGRAPTQRFSTLTPSTKDPS